jgi:hypothetical protein
VFGNELVKAIDVAVPEQIACDDGVAVATRGTIVRFIVELSAPHPPPGAR